MAQTIHDLRIKKFATVNIFMRVPSGTEKVAGRSMSTYTPEQVQWALKWQRVGNYDETVRVPAGDDDPRREAVMVGLPRNFSPHDVLDTALAEQQAEIARLQAIVTKVADGDPRNNDNSGGYDCCFCYGQIEFHEPHDADCPYLMAVEYIASQA